MKTLLLITAQVHENYNLSDEPHWKPKGAQMFSVNIESDTFSYAKEECVKAINKLLEEQSNKHTKFTYVDSELIFHGINKLDDNLFEQKLEEQFKS